MSVKRRDEREKGKGTMRGLGLKIIYRVYRNS